MPATNHSLERLRWKVGLGLVVVAAALGAHSTAATDSAPNVARSSWGAEADMARSSWGAAEAVDVARSSWGVADFAADAA